MRRDTFVNIHTTRWRRLIRDAEYQARLDRDSGIVMVRSRAIPWAFYFELTRLRLKSWTPNRTM